MRVVKLSYTSCIKAHARSEFRSFWNVAQLEFNRAFANKPGNLIIYVTHILVTDFKKCTSSPRLPVLCEISLGLYCEFNKFFLEMVSQRLNYYVKLEGFDYWYITLLWNPLGNRYNNSQWPFKIPLSQFNRCKTGKCTITPERITIENHQKRNKWSGNRLVICGIIN